MRHEIEDEDDILKDGEIYRVPLTMMDSAQKAIASDPRARLTFAKDRAEQAYARYCTDLDDAWRGEKNKADHRELTADQAYEEHRAWLHSSWKGGR